MNKIRGESSIIFLKALKQKSERNIIDIDWYQSHRKPSFITIEDYNNFNLGMLEVINWIESLLLSIEHCNEEGMSQNNEPKSSIAVLQHIKILIQTDCGRHAAGWYNAMKEVECWIDNMIFFIESKTNEVDYYKYVKGTQKLYCLYKKLDKRKVRK